MSEWERNNMNGKEYLWVMGGRIERIGPKPYLYSPEYWGDFSLKYPIYGPVYKTLGKARKWLETQHNGVIST